ncbi:MAG: nucleotidyltransferase domain-containing protein, partial [Oscillospiraceae bacterium]|nr:nucleotidyltransferase domain-containing protein [Oscillospiraceae bacterium]
MRVRPYETPEIQDELNIIKESVLQVVPDTEAIYIFGSYVYGEPHKDSDLDI